MASEFPKIEDSGVSSSSHDQTGRYEKILPSIGTDLILYKKEMKKRERTDEHLRSTLHTSPQVFVLSSACSLCLFLRVLYFVSKHLRDTQ